MKSTKITPKSVSAKDTKQTIWEAYENLLNQLKEENMSPSIATKVESVTVDVRENLNKATLDLTSHFEKANSVLSELYKLYESKKKTFEEEENQLKKSRDREEEEYRYEFEKLKKRQEEELKEYKDKVLEEIEERKAALKAEEDELSDLRVKAKGFDQELAGAIKEAVEKNTKELTDKFTHERALMEQESKAKENLLTQKILSLEDMIKSQTSQIIQLQESLRKASEQLTRIAERAVEKGTSPSSQLFSKA